ncbi:MAG: AAA family ATPase [Clostridia bacterium]
MKKFEEVKYTEMKRACKMDCLKFKTTAELEPYDGIIGQERAINAVKTAVTIPQKGFNLYLSGDVGMGKTAYALNIINKVAKKQKAPNDYCYIYNFENANEPVAISLPAGMGKELSMDMNKFIKHIKLDLSSLFTSDDFEKEKKEISVKYTNIRESIMQAFDESTVKEGFKVKTTSNGICFAPIYKGNVLNEEEFKKLDEKVRRDFEEKSDHIRQKTAEVMKELSKIEDACIDELTNYEQNVTTFITNRCIGDLKIKYKKDLKIQNFLYAVQNDVIKNFEAFKVKPNAQDAQMAGMFPGMQKQLPKPWENYRVNVLVDNNHILTAPVVRCTNPTYSDLFGKLEYENVMGSLKTDFTMLKAGLLHKANGGYLIINARDLMANISIWEAFKRVLKNDELTIDSSRDVNQNVSIISLKPEPIKLEMQVILIGGEAIYQQLSTLDPDFKKLFKIKADFEDTFERTDSNCMKLAQLVAHTCIKYNLVPFSKEAVAELIEFSSKLSGHKNKLTAQQSTLKDIMIEAATNASKVVSAEDIKKTIQAIRYRNGKYDDNLQELIEDNTIMISTNSSKVGQINGLTIISTGDCSFGKPVRITANTFIGKNGVVNIEREVSLSGTSHSKGVYILSAYIGERFAQDMPLSLTASICFEQLYNGVDGDSASSTELYSILSSLSGVPIKQGLAVTGSVNQKGEIQPIGGVSEKIEGYFNVCRYTGLTGTQGVLIPYQNVVNLTLPDYVIDAVKEGNFHIYPVRTINEGIEILTGVEAGDLTEEGVYPVNTVNALAYEKLKRYAEKSKLLSE